MKWLYFTAGFIAGYATLTGIGYASVRRAHCSTLGYAQPTQKWHRTW
jgi:predicted hydrocarbon binding protein